MTRGLQRARNLELFVSRDVGYPILADTVATNGDDGLGRLRLWHLSRRSKCKPEAGVFNYTGSWLAAPLGTRRPLGRLCSLISPLLCSDGDSMKTLTACRYVSSAPQTQCFG